MSETKHKCIPHIHHTQSQVSTCATTQKYRSLQFQRGKTKISVRHTLPQFRSIESQKAIKWITDRHEHMNTSKKCTNAAGISYLNLVSVNPDTENPPFFTKVAPRLRRFTSLSAFGCLAILYVWPLLYRQGAEEASMSQLTST